MFYTRVSVCCSNCLSLSSYFDQRSHPEHINEFKCVQIEALAMLCVLRIGDSRTPSAELPLISYTPYRSIKPRINRLRYFRPCLWTRPFNSWICVSSAATVWTHVFVVKHPGVVVCFALLMRYTCASTEPAIVAKAAKTRSTMPWGVTTCPHKYWNWS